MRPGFLFSALDSAQAEFPLPMARFARNPRGGPSPPNLSRGTFIPPCRERSSNPRHERRRDRSAATCPERTSPSEPRNEMMPPDRVDRNKLPAEWPTHRGTPAFWEELGRTVAAFGFLEDTLAKATHAPQGQRSLGKLRCCSLLVVDGKAISDAHTGEGGGGARGAPPRSSSVLAVISGCAGIRTRRTSPVPGKGHYMAGRIPKSRKRFSSKFERNMSRRRVAASS